MSLANDTNPWAPAESESAIVAERAWLQGDMLSAVAYGAQLVLFCLCFRLLYNQLSHNNSRSTLSILLFLCVAFILGTLFMASIADFAQLSFIDNRNFPGGPEAFESEMNTNPIELMGNVVFTLQNWLCDGLLVSALS